MYMYIYSSYVWLWSKYQHIDRSISEVFSEQSNKSFSSKTDCVPVANLMLFGSFNILDMGGEGVFGVVTSTHPEITF